MSGYARVFPLVFGLAGAVAALAVVPRLMADEFDNKTTINFTAPVELSGKVLPAGTYVFKTLQDDENIVVVMNGDEDRLIALINAIPVEAPVIPDKTVVELAENGPSAPEVLHAWFHPGYDIGWEFPNVKERRR